MKDSNKQNVNIGFKERKVRMIFGIVILLASVVITFLLVHSGANLWWGLVLFPAWYQGIRFILDYITGTCPLKAELGQIRLEAFMSVFGKKLEDRELALRIRAKSRKALFQAVAVAFLLTVLTIILIATY